MFATTNTTSDAKSRRRALVAAVYDSAVFPLACAEHAQDGRFLVYGLATSLGLVEGEALLAERPFVRGRLTAPGCSVSKRICISVGFVAKGWPTVWLKSSRRAALG